MGKTRSRKSSARRSYRRRTKRSMCKNRNYNTCRKMRGCKWYKGKTRGKGYCRKAHNKSRKVKKSRKMSGGNKEATKLGFANYE